MPFRSGVTPPPSGSSSGIDVGCISIGSPTRAKPTVVQMGVPTNYGSAGSPGDGGCGLGFWTTGGGFPFGALFPEPVTPHNLLVAFVALTDLQPDGFVVGQPTDPDGWGMIGGSDFACQFLSCHAASRVAEEGDGQYYNWLSPDNFNPQPISWPTGFVVMYEIDTHGRPPTLLGAAGINDMENSHPGLALTPSSYPALALASIVFFGSGDNESEGFNFPGRPMLPVLKGEGTSEFWPQQTTGYENEDAVPNVDNHSGTDSSEGSYASFLGVFSTSGGNINDNAGTGQPAILTAGSVTYDNYTQTSAPSTDEQLRNLVVICV